MKCQAKVLDSKINNTRALEPLRQFVDKHIKKDVGYNIERLHELVFDPVTQENKLWITRLLNNFLQEVGSTGYKVKYLPAVMEILEFLAWRSSDVPEYGNYLNNMLHLCAYPPLLEKYSENLTCSEVLDHYFSVLGYLAVILLNHNDVKVLEAINQLLTRPKPVDITAVKLELCHRSVERSKLPTILTELVMICSNEIYKNVLDTTYIVASISNVCCHKMLAAGILNYLLSRLVESSQEKSNTSLKDYKVNEIIITTNILWLLMKSILPPERLPDSLKNLPAPSPSAMRSMRNFFRIITFGQSCNSKAILIRNDLTAIILAGLIALPSLPLVNFDLADDVIKVAVMRESWNNEDVFFKKILLLILCQFSKYDRLIPIMIEYCAIEYILQLIEDSNNDTKSSQISGHSYLVPYALQTLTFLVPKMPDQFVKYKGSNKLLTIVKWNVTTAINSKDTLESIKTISSIVACSSPILLADFLEAKAIEIISKFIENISGFDQLSIHHQKIVTLLIITIEALLASNKKMIEIHGDRIISILMKFLEKYLWGKKSEFPIDDRLLVAVGACLWKCTSSYPMLIEKFIKIRGLYLTLDVIEQTNRHIQNIYLGLLIDLCSNPSCIPHICTWRGTDKTKGLLSLLAKLWRDEERRIGVKRTREGCIEDLELPIMGTIQWKKSYISKTDQDFSPAIATMFGSVRPKVYSIRKIMLNNSYLCEQTKEHYKILLYNLPIEDSITFCIVDQFFRFSQGQVWAEVLRYMRQAGVIPVGTDGEMLLVMRQRHRQCAAYVQKRQEKLLKEVKRQEMIQEQEELNRIRDIIYADTLIKLENIDYIRRTADEEYRLKRKEGQIICANKNNKIINNMKK